MLPAGVAHGPMVAAIAKVAETALKSVGAVRYAAVSILSQNRLEIRLLDETRRVVLQDVVPVLAMNQAHNIGRNALRNAGLDSDLLNDALADLELKRQRRRDRL
ncbi:hypothetical protein PZB75_18520 [Streptomyces sp. AM 4-1-1]|uniref:hypothetical protein n=1 Tax=unclassified Streptomyces TaxID=2593676 RepID=UPI0023BA0FDE|nr:hypothetical protein [Streptomyces sp. AM 4-1-1]WEH35178.1 hypothetical protein PZB75_18520 [Streptomyces sp. AM 4-1-1]